MGATLGHVFWGLFVHFAPAGGADQLSIKINCGKMEGEIALSVPEFPS